MALKSGLLSESTWALDVLAVMLRDDVTVAWFGLQHLPGLVDVLLEHLRRYLIELYPGDFDDLEAMAENSASFPNSRNKDTEDLKTEFGANDPPSSCPSKPGASSQVVQIEASSPDEDLVFDDKRWDVYGDVDSSMLDWQMGRGDLTTHIQTHFSRLGSLDFGTDRFFGRSNSMKIQDASGVQDQKSELSISSPAEITENRSSDSGGGVSRSTSEHLGVNSRAKAVVCSETDSVKPAEKITDRVSSCSGTESLDSIKEKTSSLSGAGTVPTVETCQPLAAGCKHGICKTRLTAEDDDDGDRKWLRLELKRLWSDDWDRGDDLDEDQNLSVLYVVGDDYQDTSSRCLALSNVIRGLSFIPGNDSELARHPGVVASLSRLLLFRHQHFVPGSKPIAHPDDMLVGRPGCQVADVLRENALVTFANISGQLELASYPEEICVPVLDGLLHWASCHAPCAVDPLPSAIYHRDLVSAQRLALEALCKLCVTDSNVDLLLATPPFDRVVSILGNLVGAMASPDCDQVWREFAIVFASSLVAGDPGVARALALHRCTIPVLVGFVEAAVADSSTSAGGTSADMVRRATAVLRAVAELPEGRSDLARNYQSRVLQLAVSPSLESTVLNAFAHILHVCSQPEPEL